MPSMSFGQLISAFQTQPFLGCRLNEREHHQLCSLLLQRAFGAHSGVIRTVIPISSGQPFQSHPDKTI